MAKNVDCIKKENLGKSCDKKIEKTEQQNLKSDMSWDPKDIVSSVCIIPKA